VKRIKWIVLLLLAIPVPFVIALANRNSTENHERADIEYALESEDADVRLGAIAELAKYGELAVPSIRKALKDGDERVKGAAIGALARIPGKPSADALAELLTDPDRNTRARVILALGLTGRAAMPHLFRALETEPFPRGRMFAASALDRLVVPGDAPAIMERFERQDTATKMHLVAALVSISDEEAYAGLDKLFHSQNARIRFYIVNAMAEAPQKDDLPIFIKGIRDESDDVRMWAMYGLENLNLPESYPVVLTALDDEVWYIRKEAAYTLGALGNPAAVPHLLPYLRDPHPLVRGSAVESLGRLGSPKLIPAIKPLLAEKYPPIRIKAAEALARLNDYSGMGKLMATLDSPQMSYRREARRALRRISNEDFGWDRQKWEQWWEGAKATMSSAPAPPVRG